jgi:hypothetical protein
MTVAHPHLWQHWKELEQLAVLAMFEDSATCHRVKEFCEGLARELGGRCKITQHLWVASTLRWRELQEIAAEEAGASDLIVISVHQAGSIAAEVKKWFDLWVLQKRTRPAILLALLNGTSEGASGSTRAYLQEVARRGGMEFVVESEPGA